jgi:hypothetical protein
VHVCFHSTLVRISSRPYKFSPSEGRLLFSFLLVLALFCLWVHPRRDATFAALLFHPRLAHVLESKPTLCCRGPPVTSLAAATQRSPAVASAACAVARAAVAASASVREVARGLRRGGGVTLSASPSCVGAAQHAHVHRCALASIRVSGRVISCMRN